ncbi:MAG: hypothetical protein M1409_02920, partial [Actinobacteria bacterium]|nr:hypothetical protein [Actinomycetota bacterium]
MHIIYDDFYLKHDAGPSHIENPARLKFIIEEINNFRYREKLNFVEPFEASQKQVAALHDISYINEVKRLSAEGGYHYLDLDTIVSENTFKCAMLAAGGCFKGIDLILGGNHINYMKQKSEAASG